MKHLDFTIDFETCALTANAAPMQVAIVPWRREAKDDPFVCEHGQGPFFSYVDLRSCVVEGMDFDPKTIAWWSRQSDNAKHAVCQGHAEPISDVLVGLLDYIRSMTQEYSIDSLCLWSQGDTDMGILRNLCRRHGYDMEKNVIPHTQLRDCRTVILEAALIEAERSMAGKSTRANGIALPHQVQADPSLAYKLFDPLPDRYAEGREAHDALYDATRSTWYTWQSLKTLQK